eukprot:5012361-Prymnesium_polylepis.1
MGRGGVQDWHTTCEACGITLHVPHASWADLKPMHDTSRLMTQSCTGRRKLRLHRLASATSEPFGPKVRVYSSIPGVPSMIVHAVGPIPDVAPGFTTSGLGVPQRVMRSGASSAVAWSM